MFIENIEDSDTHQNVGENQSTSHDTENCLVLSSFSDMLAENQKQDQTLSPIVHKHTQRIPVPRFTLNNGILKYKKNSKCSPKEDIPQNMRAMIMKYHHDTPVAAHLGIKKTVVRIEYTWENMFADIKDYVRSCPECQLSMQYSV